MHDPTVNCPAVKYLRGSWRAEGMGWRCPACGATYTLRRDPTPIPPHQTPYGVHPRAECGPRRCDLLPPWPVMVWVRDEVTAS